MNRNQFASTNDTATSWLGGRRYAWLSTASSKSTSTTKRRRTNSQTASTLAHHPSDTTRNLPDRTEPPAPPPQEERPPPVQLDGPAEAPPERASPTRSEMVEKPLQNSADPPVKQHSPTGRLPTPRHSMVPNTSDVRSPPQPTPQEESVASVPTPTSKFPSPQVQAAPTPAPSFGYSCFDRRLCLDKVSSILRFETMSAASRARCGSLQQAMMKNDHEYMILHQFMSLALLGRGPGNNLVVQQAMAHLASVTTVAFGEPAGQSSLKHLFGDLPLPLRSLGEKDSVHLNFHHDRLNEVSNTIVQGWAAFKQSKLPFTVQEFRRLGLTSPEWQRIASLAKIKLLIQATGIRQDLAKTYQFENKLVALFQAHQALTERGAGGAIETTKQEMMKIIAHMEEISNQNARPKQTSADAQSNGNLGLLPAQPQPQHVDDVLPAQPQPQQPKVNSNVIQAQQQQFQQQSGGSFDSLQAQLRQSQHLNQQAYSMAEDSNQQQREWMQRQIRMTQQQQDQVIQQRQRERMVAQQRQQSHSSQQTMRLSMIQPPNERILTQGQQNLSQSPVQCPVQFTPTLPSHNPMQQHQSFVTVQHGRSDSPARMPAWSTQDTVRNQAEQHQGHLPAAAPQQKQQTVTTPSEKLFQSVVGFVVPPQKLEDAPIQDFEFEISPDELANVPRKPGQLNNQTVVYRLRCVRIPDGATDISKDEWMSTPITWPMGTLIIINDVNVRPQKIQEKWKSVFLGPSLKQATNLISLNVLRKSNEPLVSSFALAVEKITFQTEANIIASVISPERLVSAASVMASIRSAILPKEGEDSGDELAVTMSRITINLIDPQSASKICDVPVRSLACKHRDCFDLATYLNSRPGMITGVDEWRCPICRADARPAQLVVDGFLVDVRKQLEMRGELATAKTIIVDADGSWSVREEEETQMRGRSERRTTGGAAASASASANAAAAGATDEPASTDLFGGGDVTAMTPSAWDELNGMPVNTDFAEALNIADSLATTNTNTAAVAMEAASGAPLSVPTPGVAARPKGGRNAPIVIDLSDDDDD